MSFPPMPEPPPRWGETEYQGYDIPGANLRSSDNGHAHGEKERYFIPLTAQEVMNRPPKPWLIDQIIGEKDFVMLFGESGSGKTFISFNLIMHAITGRGRFSGEFEVLRPMRVIYMTSEGLSGLGQRIKSAVQSFGVSDDELENLELYEQIIQFVNPAYKNYYMNFLDELKVLTQEVDILWLDHLSSTLPGKGDSDQAAATEAQAAIAHIHRELECAVIVNHHTGYDTSHGRGMTNYKDIADMQIQTKGTSNPRTLICVKNKDGGEWQSRTYDIVPFEGTESCTISWGGRVQTPVDLINNALDLLESEIAKNPGLNQSAIVQLMTKYGWGRNKTRARLRDLGNRIIMECSEGSRENLYYVA